MSLNVNALEDDMVYVGTSRDARAKQVGHQIYDSIPQTNSPYRSNYSSSSIGSQSNNRMDSDRNKRISTVRRTFCLIVTFDLILTFILWVIYTQLIGETPVWNAFEEQVYKYSFQFSLFDTVMVAAIRAALLLLAYALYRLKHWWMIAITTSLTCAFLLVKCFLFKFNASRGGGENPLSYMLLIISFVLAWVETWFLDFKVLPQEKKDRERANYYKYTDDERQPILPRDGRQSRDEYERFVTPQGSDEETDRSDYQSMVQSRSRQASRASINSISSVREFEFMKIGVEAFDILWELYQLEEGWKLTSGQTDEEGMVYNLSDKKYPRKMFKVRGIINMKAEELYRELVENMDEQPTWNPTVTECRTLQTVDEYTDVVYNIAAEAAGGMVSARDFVNVRHWGVKEGVYLSAGCACAHPDMPSQKKYVRGENGAGGFVIIPCTDDPNKSLFMWFVNSDLKGWIPQTIIDQAMSFVVKTFYENLCKHIETLNRKRGIS